LAIAEKMFHLDIIGGVGAESLRQNRKRILLLAHAQAGGFNAQSRGEVAIQGQRQSLRHG
jgi:hypothetical protein